MKAKRGLRQFRKRNEKDECGMRNCEHKQVLDGIRHGLCGKVRRAEQGGRLRMIEARRGRMIRLLIAGAAGYYKRSRATAE